MHRTKHLLETFITGGRLLAFAVMILPVCAAAQDNSTLGRVMEELNKSDQEHVVDALKGRLNDEDREFAEQLVRDGKNIKKLSEQIAKGDYTGLGNAFANATKDKLVREFEARYPEGSKMRRVLNSVKSNPDLHDLHAKLAKAALNADPDMARIALKDALKEYAETKIGALRNEGEEFWKDLLRSVIPGSGAAKRVGLDPVSIYLQAVEDVTDLSVRANRQLDVFVFDCMHRRYRKLIREGSSDSDARDTVASAGPNDQSFDCVADRKRDQPQGLDPNELSWTDSILLAPGRAYRAAKDFAQGRSRGGSTMAKWQLDPDEIAKLIEVYEEGLKSGEITNKSFVDWVGASLWDKLKKRKTELTDALEQDQVKVAEVEAERLRRIIESLKTKLPEILKAALGEDRYRKLAGLPEKDKAASKPEEAPKAADEAKTASKEDKQYDEIMKELKDRECDPVKRTAPKVDKDGFVSQAEDYGEPVEPPPGCEPYGPAAQAQDDGIKTYEYEGPNKSGADKEKAEAETKLAHNKARCARLDSAIDTAGSQYAIGQIKIAKVTLDSILTQLDEAGADEKCPDVHARAIANVRKIKRMTDVLADLKESLSKCEPDRLRLQHQQLKNATHKKLIAVRERLLRAVPVAEKYTLATLAYREGRIDDAEALFRKTLVVVEETDQRTCVDIESRTRRNLGRVDQVKGLEKAATGAVERCDTAEIEQRKAQLVGTTNPFLVNLRARLGNLPARCLQQVSDGECARKYGSGWTAGPADEKGQFFCRPPNTAAANQWCEENSEGSGWVAGDVASNGSFGCNPSYSRQRSAALTDCKQQYGSRLIKVYHYKGNWYCSYRQKTVKKRATKPRARTARRRRSGGYDPRAAAAAAAVAGAVIQGIVRSQRGRGGGGNCAANPRAPGC